MAYNQNIPNASDFLSDSQGQLKENFQQLQTQFSKNHVPLSPNSSNNGRHTFVEMRNVTGSQEIPPTPSSTPWLHHWLQRKERFILFWERLGLICIMFQITIRPGHTS